MSSNVAGSVPGFGVERERDQDDIVLVDLALHVIEMGVVGGRGHLPVSSSTSPPVFLVRWHDVSKYRDPEARELADQKRSFPRASRTAPAALPGVGLGSEASWRGASLPVGSIQSWSSLVTQ